MKRKIIVLMVLLAVASTVNAATQQEIQQAIDNGLAYLASTQSTSGTEGYWSYANYGTLAATGSAALAFIEEGYLPGSDVIIGGTNYGDVVGKSVNYIFNRATVEPTFGVETAGYTRYAEDYNNDGVFGNDAGNNQAIYFNPGYYTRNVYTTGIVTPVVYALGEALGPDTTVGVGAVTSSMTYREVMRDVVDWFSFAQVEPNRGVYRGGWRYYANEGSSDNSTAQWGALPILYGNDWGLPTPQYVKDELELWTHQVQNTTVGPLYGSSGYTGPTGYNNVAKTGGLLLEFAVIDQSTYNLSNWRVDAALDFIDNRWMNGPSGTWYGNLNHPYAMWAAYKALEVYGFTSTDIGQDGILGPTAPGPDGIWGTDDDICDDYLIGSGMSNAPGGIEIGQDWFDGDGDITTSGVQSVAGDWYSHYCDYLVGIQNGNGSWNGYSYWTGALAGGWYINILNAGGAPPVIPVPAAFLLGSIGLSFAGWRLRRRKEL